MGSSGRRTQPVIPASAIDAPITFRKPRRETESTHSEAPLGNSRCSASWKAGLPASSSRLRQYSGPALWLASSICARSESRSSLPFLLGQKSSRLAILLCSSILSPLRGFFLACTSPTACAVGCILSPLRGFTHKLYRWHVLQLVMSFTLRTLYFFTSAEPSSI